MRPENFRALLNLLFPVSTMMHKLAATRLLLGLFLVTSALAQAEEDKDDASGDIGVLNRKLESADPKSQQSALGSLQYCGRLAWPAVSGLVHVVRNENTSNKIQALQLLAAIGQDARPAIPAITQALSDPDADVRVQAAIAFLQVGGGSREAAIRVLSAALRDKMRTSGQRLAVAKEITWLGVLGRGIEAALIETAQDKREDETVRAQAAMALGMIGADPEERSLPALRVLLKDAAQTIRVRAARALWQLDEPADALVAPLIKVLNDYQPDPKTDPIDELFFDHEFAAKLAANLLGEIGPESKSALPDLLAAVEQARPALRIAAIDALGALGPEAMPAIERLAKALRDSEVFSVPMIHHAYCVSDQAAIALRRIGPASTGTLLAALGDADDRVRVNAASALGYLPDPQGKIATVLGKLLDDKHQWIRAAAVAGLGRLGSERAVKELSTHLNDPGSWLSFPSPAGGIGTRHTVGDEILAALAKNTPEPNTMIPALVVSLKSNHSIGIAMVEMLRRLGPDARQATAAIAPLLKDPKQRLQAAIALTRICPDYPGLLEILQTALVEPKHEQSVQAARGLGDLGTRAKAMIPALYAELQRVTSPSAKAIVAAAIVRIDGAQSKAIIDLAAALQKRPGIFRLAGHDEATATWRTVGGHAKPAIALLINSLKYRMTDPKQEFFWAAEDEEATRLCSAELLIDVSTEVPRAIETLAELCRKADCVNRGMAADALGRLGPMAARAASELVALLPDGELYVLGGDFYGNGGIRDEPGNRAELALSKIGPRAISALRTGLKPAFPR